MRPAAQFCVMVRGDGPVHSNQPLVGVIMGSKSDWDTMRHADEMLTAVRRAARVPASSPRTARRRGWPSTRRPRPARGLEVIIAGAGGAAHLPGMVAAQTVLPVIGVPVQSAALQRPRLAAVDRADAEGRAGGDASRSARRARPTPALLAVAILATSRPELRAKLRGLPRRA